MTQDELLTYQPTPQEMGRAKIAYEQACIEFGRTDALRAYSPKHIDIDWDGALTAMQAARSQLSDLDFCSRVNGYRRA